VIVLGEQKMSSKRLLAFSIVLITVTQACIFSAEQAKPAFPDTNVAASKDLKELKTSIESLRLKVNKIKESVDTTISKEKKRHAQQILNDYELLQAQRKVSLIREALGEYKKHPPTKGVTRQAYYNFGPNGEKDTDRISVDIDYVGKTITARKRQDDGTIMTVTFQYPSPSSPLEQAMQEVQKIKSEIARPQGKEIQELTVVRNSVEPLLLDIVKIKKMLDANSVNLEQVDREIGNLDKKIADAEAATHNELLRISKKYQGNNITEDESDVNNKADENDSVGGKVLLIVSDMCYQKKLFDIRRIFQEAGIKIMTADKEIGPFEGKGVFVTPDMTLDKVRVEDFKAVVFVDDDVDTTNETVLDIVRKAAAGQKVIAAKGFSVKALENAHVLKRRRPHTSTPVQREGLIITADVSSTDVEFAEAIVATLSEKQPQSNKTP
jgi:hypothetical protein